MGFASNLLNWLRTEYDMDDETIRLLIEQTEAIVPKRCYDPTDIGCACCPF